MNLKEEIKQQKLHSCPFCKNEDTSSVMDIDIIYQLKAMHGESPFFAFQCNLCEGMWHFSEDYVIKEGLSK